MNLTVNSPVCGLRVASILTGLGALAHFVRLVRPFQILIGSHPVPILANLVGFLVLGLLSFWFWKLSGTINPVATNPPPPATTAMP
jgi:hypothetical protein